jgi:rSAM/selenodomain-associated transferase 1
LSPRPLDRTARRPPRGKRAAPALIVFAREPIAGRVKTRLIARVGAAVAARLADAFISDALAKAAAFEGCRLVIAGDAPGSAHDSRYFQRLARRFGAELADQGEGDLGQRMARVLRRYKDAPGAVLFGTDTPSLPPAFISQSIDDLREVPVVVAPALDGGYYLVGVCGLMPDIFGAIEWGSGKVMEQTLRHLSRLRIPYRLGRWWYDIDRAADLDFLALDLARGLCASRRQFVCPATVGLLRELGLLKSRPDLRR